MLQITLRRNYEQKCSILGDHGHICIAKYVNSRYDDDKHYVSQAKRTVQLNQRVVNIC